MKLVIIANRLPVKIEKKNNRLTVKPSAGGLATGLGSLKTKIEKVWVGWPGVHVENDAEKTTITKRLEKLNYHPVFLSQQQIENYYEGYSNSTIWPLCHYFFSFIDYKTEYWEAYREVNALFAHHALDIIEDDDIIWVQDYQLMLLPRMIRSKKSKVSIGYFHHIPFPSYELFRLLPERDEVLDGLLGADLIGFHTHDYMRHFISAVYRVLGIDCNLDEIRLQNRMVHVDAFPMGINYEQYHNDALLPAVAKKANALKRKKMANQKVILSVDRLDYSKGILHRLDGFAQFLKNHTEYHEKVSLAMIVVPSRDEVHWYAELKSKINQAIGEINGRYSTMGWTPIHYFYRSFDYKELIAMYYNADIALVTPLRDGMNLVAKEYLATKHDKPGVLILSEMAGAAIELADALIINPTDVQEIEDAILKALTMSEEERRERLQRMQKRISTQTVKKWANDFVEEMKSIQDQNKNIYQKIITKKQFSQIKKQYDKAQSRLIMLDYDGTLAPFVEKPQDAVPSKALLAMMRKMIADTQNKVIVNSGRNHQVLDEWFSDFDIDFAAEHGAFYKEDGKWHQNLAEKQAWNQEIIDIIQHTIDKTPRSTLEIKDAALVWHFRNVDMWLAELREKQLINALMEPAARQNLQIVRGNKIVELKSPEFTKGSEVDRRLQQKTYDFVLAIGDDTTDEDMFRALPETGISIKVGNYSEVAKYRIPLQSKVIPFFEDLIQ